MVQYMIRKKYYVPLNEVYRAYNEHNSKNPSNFIFASDYEDNEVDCNGDYYTDVEE